jgi:hypothetical protein
MYDQASVPIHDHQALMNNRDNPQRADLKCTQHLQQFLQSLNKTFKIDKQISV